MSPISSVGLLPPIHSIPNEILYLITSHLPLSSLPALVLVNHRLNTLCTPELYTPVPATAGLRYAATSGSVVVARIFIERYGVEPNTRFREDKTEGMTALHVAASRGHEELVAYLLAAGSGVEERNEAKRSPLHCAAHSGRLGAARLLVEAGADVGGRDETEGTALHGAAKKGHHLVCRYLLDNGAEVDAMCKDPQNEVDDGYTSLHGAADFGHAEVAKLLLERGARVDAKIEQSEWTPLGCASAEGHEDVVAHLLAFGAEVNVAPEVPLRLAVDGKWHEGVLRLLLAHGANVESALEGLFHTETAKRLEEFAEAWRSREAAKIADEVNGGGADDLDTPTAQVFEMAGLAV